MKKLRNCSLLLAAMAIVSLLCFILARLAMNDIFHGEADVELEWSVVSLSFVPILAFHAVACGIGLATAKQASHLIRRSS